MIVTDSVSCKSVDLFDFDVNAFRLIIKRTVSQNRESSAHVNEHQRKMKENND